MTEESNLENLKDKYKELQEKYNLPEFKELNENFQIEKIAEIETDTLAREIRKFIADRLNSYLRFTEALLNPTNVQMFVFYAVKTLSNEDKNNLKEIYKKLAKREIELISTDIEYDESKEAKFISESYKAWQEIKKDISKIVDTIKNNWDTKFEVNGKSYFG